MTLLIMRFTVGQLLRQRRTLLLALLAALPLVLALIFRFTGGTPDRDPEFAPAILVFLLVGLVLPLTALVVGTGAMGQDLEDGTVVYLMAKPVPRWQVVVAKIAAAWLVTSAVVLLSAVTSGLVMLAGYDDTRLVAAFAVAVVVGALAYATAFVSLSVRFGRALIIGLAYVFLWEALVSQFIPGVRFLSIRAYTLSVADAAADSLEIMDTPLRLATALALIAVVTAFGTWYAVRRLKRYEISERV